MPAYLPRDNTGQIVLELVARRHPTFTDAAFCRWSGEDAATLSRIRHGREAMSTSLLAMLVRYTGDAGLLGDLAARGNAEVVPMPPAAPTAGELRDELLRLGGQIGRLQAGVAEAMHPASADGVALAESERVELACQAQTLYEQVASIKAQLAGRPRMVG